MMISMNQLKIIDKTFLLRLAMALILLSHSLHALFTENSVRDFGQYFLNPLGFDPFGVIIAWMIMLAQVITGGLLLVNIYVKPAAIINIFILLMGIYWVHWPAGWFVVGAGTGGMEFNVVLILILLTLIFPAGVKFIKPTESSRGSAAS